MFGYVRPFKPELLVREYTRYRSVYCGLCKQIGCHYGQLPRLSVGYDLTFLAILLLSLTDRQPDEKIEGCILNPMVKKLIVRSGEVLDLCAGLSVMLAWHKASDNVRDGRSAAGLAAMWIFGLARRNAEKRFPEYGRIIGRHMAELEKIETGTPDLSAADLFGNMLKEIFKMASGLVTDEENLSQGVALMGYDLGKWIYLIDAIDDLADDCNNGNWNPFSGMEPEKARETAGSALEEQEMAIDRTAALLPYDRDAGLIANIVTQGLPQIRAQILRGEKPVRL